MSLKDAHPYRDPPITELQRAVVEARSHDVIGRIADVEAGHGEGVLQQADGAQLSEWRKRLQRVRDEMEIAATREKAVGEFGAAVSLVILGAAIFTLRAPLAMPVCVVALAAAVWFKRLHVQAELNLLAAKRIANCVAEVVVEIQSRVRTRVRVSPSDPADLIAEEPAGTVPAKKVGNR